MSVGVFDPDDLVDPSDASSHEITDPPHITDAPDPVASRNDCT